MEEVPSSSDTENCSMNPDLLQKESLERVNSPKQECNKLYKLLKELIGLKPQIKTGSKF